MADPHRIDELAAVTSLDVADLFLVEVDPAGTPLAKKITKANMVSTMKATGAEVTTGTEDGKLATPKAIKDAGIVAPAFASAAETTTGTSTTKAVTPDGLAGSDYGKRVVEIALNGALALTTDDKAYFRIPAVLNGYNLVAVAAMCKTCTTHPHVTLKNGATSMLSNAEAITIDDGEYDTSTSATPPVIDTAHDEVATGNQIELACTTAGAGVTYFVAELTFQLP